MYRSAEIDSLSLPLQELQDRVSLEVPAGFMQEESIREAGDQQSARYGLIYYLREDNEPDGRRLDIQSIVKRLAEDVLSAYDVVWTISNDGRGRNTQRIDVTVTWPPKEEQEDEFFVGAATNDLLDVVPLTVYADNDVINIATDGNTFQVLVNGQRVLEDAPSAAFALGALVPLLRDALADIEFIGGIEPSAEHDFLEGIAPVLLDDPNIPDEAREHFITFLELTTLKDWVGMETSED